MAQEKLNKWQIRLIISIIFAGLIFSGLFFNNSGSVLAASPSGRVDGVSDSGIVYGWAFDGDHRNDSIRVHLYIDGGAGSANGRYAGEVYTNVLRQDVNNAYGLSGNHGFEIRIAIT